MQSEMQYAAPKYTAALLPSGFVPTAMMKSGQIPGFIGKKAAIYRNGALAILGQYNSEATIATSVNSTGVAVGYTTTSTAGAARAVKYANGAFTALPDPANCQYANQAQTIDDLGDIYGTCYEAGETNSPQIARYAPGTPSLISGPYSGRGTIYNVNASGTFVYSGYYFANDGMSAAYGANLTATGIFPTLRWSSATWINDAGTIVGWRSLSSTSSPAPERPYEYPKGGPVKLLPMLTGATMMVPAGINKYGTVVGNWDNGIFVYKSGVMYDVTNSITPAGNYTAYPGLADSGAFAAADHSGHAFIIKPAP